MAYTEEKKQEVLHLLTTEAGNNTTRCAQLTGISKTTILSWKKAQETQNLNGKNLLIPAIPSTLAPLPEISPVTGNPTLSLHDNQPVSSGNIPERPTPAPSPEATKTPGTSEMSQNPDTPEADPIPTPTELKRRIIRRVSQLIDTCTDPKKLMDTHEALSKSERDSAPPTQESLFDLLSRQFLEKK